MSNLEIKLKEGLRLRNPIDATLLESGIVYTVPNDKFWRKRLRDGDVYLAVEEVKSSPVKDKASEDAQALPAPKKPLSIGSK